MTKIYDYSINHSFSLTFLLGEFTTSSSSYPSSSSSRSVSHSYSPGLHRHSNPTPRSASHWKYNEPSSCKMGSARMTTCVNSSKLDLKVPKRGEAAASTNPWLNF